MLEQAGILGTNASLASDLSLLAYILLLVPAMAVGFVFARRKMFEPYHKLTMTTITIVNWIIIAFLMAVRYSQAVSGGFNSSVILPSVHLLFGGTAQLLATYLVIRMWFEKQLPAWFKVRRIKPYMRATLALWFITALLGMGTYYAWYVAGTPADDAGAPAATPEATEAVMEEATAESAPEATEETAEDTDEETAEDENEEAAEEMPEATPEMTPES
jgi:hypothetical protein